MTTTAENRDAIARAMGWEYATSGWFDCADASGNKYQIHALADDWVWHQPGYSRAQRAHPVPNTADAALDAFARLLPGAVWYRHRTVERRLAPTFKAYSANNHLIGIVEDTGDFKSDLFALVVKALEARKA